jgi:hypothetical protein
MVNDDDIEMIDGGAALFGFEEERKGRRYNMGTNMDENARRILADARATLERTAGIVVEEPDHLAIALARHVTPQIDRDRAAIAKQERHFARQREREAQRNRREAAALAARAPAAIDWGEVDRRCKAAAREAVLGCAREVADALREERAVARRELASEVRSLRLELTEANEVIGELRKAIAASNRTSGSVGEIIDLQPLARRN